MIFLFTIGIWTRSLNGKLPKLGKLGLTSRHHGKIVHAVRFAWAPHGALAGESKVNEGKEIWGLHKLGCIFTYIVYNHVYIPFLKQKRYMYRHGYRY